MLKDCFYFGNYTPDGWASIIKKNRCTDYKKISVCGYPRCVKQQIFKRIRLNLLRRNICFENLMIENGSMGIICEKLKFIVADGDLVFLDKSEIINISDFICDDVKIETEEKIGKFDKEIKRLEMRCERFLTACKSINDDMRRIDSASVDFSKLNRFTSRIWKKYGSKPTGKIGIQEKMFVTCISKDGIELDIGAFEKQCKDILVIYDKTGACSSSIVERIKNYAISNGHDVISCICPANLDIEHIIIPELGFGIFSSRYYHRADFDNIEKIYSSKFHTFNSPSTIQRLDFSNKTYKALMNEAFDCVAGIEEMNKNIDLMLYKSTDVLRLYNQIAEKIFL